LLRRAGFAFDKMQKILRRSPAGEGFVTTTGKEILTILLKVLLPNEQYCQRSNADTFQCEQASSATWARQPKDRVYSNKHSI
jgi:hypothetical protein